MLKCSSTHTFSATPARFLQDAHYDHFPSAFLLKLSMTSSKLLVWDISHCVSLNKHLISVLVHCDSLLIFLNHFAQIRHPYTRANCWLSRKKVVQVKPQLPFFLDHREEKNKNKNYAEKSMGCSE